MVSAAGGVGAVANVFEACGLNIIQMSFESEYDERSENSMRVVRIKLHKPNAKQLLNAVDAVLAIDNVKAFETSDKLRDYKTYVTKGASTSI